MQKVKKVRFQVEITQGEHEAIEKAMSDHGFLTKADFVRNLFKLDLVVSEMLKDESIKSVKIISIYPIVVERVPKAKG